MTCRPGSASAPSPGPSCNFALPDIDTLASYLSDELQALLAAADKREAPADSNHSVQARS
jgi:hypothetical protein